MLKLPYRIYLPILYLLSSLTFFQTKTKTRNDLNRLIKIKVEVEKYTNQRKRNNVINIKIRKVSLTSKLPEHTPKSFYNFKNSTTISQFGFDWTYSSQNPTLEIFIYCKYAVFQWLCEFNELMWIGQGISLLFVTLLHSPNIKIQVANKLLEHNPSETGGLL